MTYQDLAFHLSPTAPNNIISFGHQPPAKSMTVRHHPSNRSIDSVRIAKVIARAGLCSRRDAERWITEGRVSVNGKMLDTPAFTVGPNDRVVVDGRPLPASEEPRLFLYNKPAGLVTTVRDEKRRPTVFAHLPHGLPRVVSVGRLDINSEGLLLLTNDGGLARYLELPATALKRCYRMRLHGPVNAARLARLRQGITVDGVRYGPMEARMEGPHSGSNAVACHHAQRRQKSRNSQGHGAYGIAGQPPDPHGLRSVSIRPSTTRIGNGSSASTLWKRSSPVISPEDRGSHP